MSSEYAVSAPSRGQTYEYVSPLYVSTSLSLPASIAPLLSTLVLIVNRLRLYAAMIVVDKSAKFISSLLTHARQYSAVRSSIASTDLDLTVSLMALTSW